LKKVRDKPDEAFVERPQEETQSQRRGRRISLKLDENGAIDWSQLSDVQKEQFFSTITNDPDVLEKVAASVGEEGEVSGEGQLCTVEHIKMFLGLYSQAESYVIPAYIRKKSKGLVKIPQDVAAKCFAFDPTTMDKIAPDGAQFVNEQIIPNLPEWLKEFLLEVGPGARFLGALAFHTIICTQQLVAYIRTMPKTVEAEDSAPSATTASPIPEGAQVIGAEAAAGAL